MGLIDTEGNQLELPMSAAFERAEYQHAILNTITVGPFHGRGMKLVDRWWVALPSNSKIPVAAGSFSERIPFGAGVAVSFNPGAVQVIW